MLAGLGLAGLVHAGLGPTPPLELKLDDLEFTGRELCYPSGLRVSIVPDSRQPIVSVVTVIDGGQVADAPGREGTAHLLEHLWYRSVTQEDGRTEDTLDALGAIYNAHTREDVTTFETMAPVTALSRVLALEVHRFVEPLAGIDATEIDAEREVVRQELLGRIEDGSMAFSALYPRLFPGHPYAATQADSPAGMAAVGLADLRAYAAEHYRPEGASMHIVGAVDPQAVRSLINLTFPSEVVAARAGEPPGTCAAHAPPSTEPPEPLDTSLQHVPAPVDSPLLMVGWTLPGAWGAGEAAARQATEVLEDAEHERLTGGAVCSYHPAVRASTVVCARAVPDGMDPDRYARRALSWRSPSPSVDPETWERWRQLSLIQNIHRVLGQAEEQISPFDAGSDVALYGHFRGEPNFVLGTLDSWASADKSAVEGVLKRYLTADRAVPVLLMPAEMQTSGSSSVARGAEQSSGAERLAGTAADVGLPGLRDFVLDNGLRVVILPYGDMSVVRATLAFRGGRGLEPAPGVDALAAAVAYPLVYNRQDAVHDAWVLFGAGGANFWRPTTQGVAYSGPSGNLDALLFLLRAATERFELVESRRTFFIENRLKWLSEVEPEAWADDVARARVLPGHPLGRLADAAFIEDTRLVGAAQIQHWIDAVTRPDNGTLFIVGGVDPDVAEAEVRSRLASWVDRSKPDPALPKLAPPPPTSRAPGAALSHAGRHAGNGDPAMPGGPPRPRGARTGGRARKTGPGRGLASPACAEPAQLHADGDSGELGGRNRRADRARTGAGRRGHRGRRYRARSRRPPSRHPGRGCRSPRHPERARPLLAFPTRNHAGHAGPAHDHGAARRRVDPHHGIHEATSRLSGRRSRGRTGPLRRSRGGDDRRGTDAIDGGDRRGDSRSVPARFARVHLHALAGKGYATGPESWPCPTLSSSSVVPAARIDELCSSPAC